MTSLEIIDLPADRVPGEALLVPLFEDQRPLDGPAAVVDWRLDGALTRMILAGELSGRNGERLALLANAKFAAPWIMVAGSGRWQNLERDGYEALIGRLLKMAARAGLKELALCLPPGEAADAAELQRLVGAALVGSGQLVTCRLSRVPRL